jgi:hypothetical protein
MNYQKRRLVGLHNELKRTGIFLGLGNQRRAANTNKGKATNRQKPKKR